MREVSFRAYYSKRGIDAQATYKAVEAVKTWERHLRSSGKTIGSSNVEDLKTYISKLISEGKNTDDRLLAISRYVYWVKKNDLFVYMAAVLGGRGVYESIGEKLDKVAGKSTRNEVFDGFVTPPLGSPPETYPSCTKALLDRLNVSLPSEIMKEALAGNHHRIPLTAYTEMKKRYDSAETIDEFLVGEHGRLVAELEETMKSGRLWYEQEITPEVVEFVRKDQRIQNGIRQGDVIIKTKIPFDPKRWLEEKDPKMKRYYACHCQLARSAILEGAAKPLSDFCYCSAGYEKYPLEVMLGVPLKVEVLESVLAGDDVCKFAVKIPHEKLK